MTWWIPTIIWFVAAISGLRAGFWIALDRESWRRLGWQNGALALIELTLGSLSVWATFFCWRQI